MKKFIKSKKILISLFALFILISSVFILSTNIFISKADFVIGDFESSYFVGDVLNVPTATIQVENQQKIADFEVVAPDGSVYVSDIIDLKQYGVYSVRYYVKGTNLTKTVKVTVDKHLFEVTGKGSAEFGYHEYLNETDSQGLVTKHGGIITSLYAGSKLLINKVIDLSALGQFDPIITFNITPSEKGYLDFERLNIKLIDLYDPSKYVILRTKDQEYDDGDYLSYSLCSINSENLYYRNDSIYFAGTLVGTEALLSFRGTPGYDPDRPDVYTQFRNYAEDKLSWYIDYYTQTLYVMGGNKVRGKVCDLDATGAWDGFTTGEVMMEIFADTYTNSYANFVIRDIAGCDISESVLVDEKSPDIFVDFGEYNEATVPNGKVGCPYGVFSATALDNVDGETAVRTMVYKNYYSSSRTAINVENNCFIPNTSGVYTICYTATDSFQNKNVKTVDVNVVDSDNPISISILTHQSNTKQNVSIDLAEVETSGGFGNINVTTSIKFGTDVFDIDSESYTPMKVGKYTVIYTAKDYVGHVATKSYDITVEHNDAPSILGSVENLFDRYYIKGSNYKLPDVKLCVFNNDGVNYTLKDATITVTNGSIVNGYYVPATEGENTFGFVCDGVAADFTLKRPVVNIKNTTGNTNNLDLKKLFVFDTSVVNADYETVDPYSAIYNISEDTTLHFVNSVFCEPFSMGFKNAVNFDAKNIVIKFTDSLNPEQTVSFVLAPTSTSTTYTLNARGKAFEISYPFTGTDFSLSLVASSGNVTLNGSTSTFTQYLSGKEYKGFSSGKVYLDISVNEVGEQGCGLIVREICVQSLSKLITSDRQSPLIANIGQAKKIGDINSTFTLPTVIACDVISPYLKNFYVSVKKPDGKSYVTSSTGVLLKEVPVDNYSFTLESYGLYNIIFTAIDFNNRSINLDASVKVLDFIAPTIVVSNNRVTSGKVGSSITIASVERLTDNYGKIDDDIGYYVMVKKPTGKMFVVTGKSFNADVAGEYTVYYYMIDNSTDDVSQGNIAIESYTVKVS